jgi:hypothetical protein
MSKKLASTLTKLFEYEELLNIYSKIGKVLVFIIYFVVITSLPLLDYSSISQLGALALKATTVLIITLLTWIISKDLTRIKTRLEQRKTEWPQAKTLYLTLITVIVITALYLAVLFT